MTSDGYSRLQEEIKRLKSTERPAIIRAIAEARTHGDLSENAEYHAARERQSFIEGRLMELEDRVARAEVIDTSKLSGTVIKFGATVTLADEETDEEQTFVIVGEDEADIKGGSAGRSPSRRLAPRAPSGTGTGDRVAVSTPRGAKSHEVGDRRFRLTSPSPPPIAGAMGPLPPPASGRGGFGTARDKSLARLRGEGGSGAASPETGERSSRISRPATLPRPRTAHPARPSTPAGSSLI